MSWIVLVGLWAFGWCVLWGAVRDRSLTLLPRLVWSFPLGLAIFGTVLTLLWYANIPFWWLFVLGWLVLSASLFGATVTLVPLLPKKLPQFSTAKWSLPFSRWPLVLMGAVSAFSLTAIVLWSATVRPVTWDNATLYDGRAGLIADGAKLQTFKDEFRYYPEGKSYDFAHPFFSSTTFAFVEKSGGEFPLLLQTGLLLSAIGAVFLIFSSPESRGSVIFFLLGARVFFERAPEGYSAWTAALFWLIALLWIKNFPPNKSWWHWAGCGVFGAAAVMCRSVEPYWVGFLLLAVFMAWPRSQGWLERSVHMVWWCVPVLWSWLIWFGISRWSSTGVMVVARPSEIVPPAFAERWRQLLPLLTLRSPMAPLFLLIIGILFLTRKQRSVNKRAIWFISLCWFLTLEGGISYLGITSPSIVTANISSLARSALPLGMALLVLLGQELDSIFTTA